MSTYLWTCLVGFCWHWAPSSIQAQEQEVKPSKVSYLLRHCYFPLDIIGYLHPISRPAVSPSFYASTGLEYRRGGDTEFRHVWKAHLGTFTSKFTNEPHNSAEVTGGQMKVITTFVGYGQRYKFSTFKAFAHVLVGGASITYPTVVPNSAGFYQVNYTTKYAMAGFLNVGMVYSVAKPFDVFVASDIGIIDGRQTFLHAGMPYFTLKMGVAAILFSPQP